MNLYSVEEGRARLHLHKGQARAWQSTARFTFVFAGSQSGKTSFGPWWLHREVNRHGAGDYLAVTSSYDLFKLKMLPEMRRVFEHVLAIGRYWSGDKVIELVNPETGQFEANRADDPMWGRIILRSATASGGLESATAHAAWLDEVGQDEFTLEAWEAVLRRLSLSEGPVLGTTTLYNLGWLKSEVYERWEKGDTNFNVIQFESTANPAFPAAEFKRAKETLPAWKFNMMYCGLFEKPAGLIYSDFNETIHWIRPFAIPTTWPRYVGIDFGAVNTATIWIAEDVDKAAFYVYRDTLEGGKTTREHAATAKAHAKQERVVAWCGGGPSETQQRMDWAAEEVAVQAPPISDVEAQIDRVIGLFKSKRLFVFDTCRGLRDELGTYRRTLGSDGQPTEKIKDKERFHRLDATRYVVAGITVENAMNWTRGRAKR